MTRINPVNTAVYTPPASKVAGLYPSAKRVSFGQTQPIREHAAPSASTSMQRNDYSPVVRNTQYSGISNIQTGSLGHEAVYSNSMGKSARLGSVANLIG